MSEHCLESGKKAFSALENSLERVFCTPIVRGPIIGGPLSGAQLFGVVNRLIADAGAVDAVTDDTDADDDAEVGVMKT